MPVRNHLFACLIALVLILSANSTPAQEPAPTPAQNVSPEKLALIRELLELANAKGTVDAILKAEAQQLEKDLPELAWQAAANMPALKSLNPTEREAFHQEVIASSISAGRKMDELLREKIDFGKLVEDISVELYDKYFTEAELRDLVAFNKSSTGKKVIETMPKLFAESMARAAEIIGPKAIEAIRQLQDEQAKQIASEIQAKASKKTTRPPVAAPKRRRH